MSKEYQYIPKEQCECHQCIKDHNLKYPRTGLPLNTMRMILCPICGNKRCPHASNHRFECTRSNDVNQKGSIFK